jgi:hypothetical protein
MPALTILIIRHAEKPGESWPGPGLTPDGAPNKRSLVVRGWQRAGSWSALFGAGLGGPDHPAPSVIYAADPTAMSGDEPSQRPFETVAPLAARLGLKPNTKFALGQEAQLANAVVDQTGVVLVSWEHKAIARALLPAIAKGQSLPGCRPSGPARALTSCCASIARRLKPRGPSANSARASLAATQPPQWVEQKR